MQIINNIKVNTESREMFPDRYVLGVQGENEVEKLVFKLDKFLGGEARLETRQDNTTKYLIMNTDLINEEYTIVLANELLKNNTSIDLQLKILVDNKEVFKSKAEPFEILEGINAEQEIEKEQLEWIDYAEEKLSEVENAIIEVKENSNYAKEQGDYAKQEAEKVNNVVEYVTTTSQEAKEIAKTAESIAKGRATGYVFDTLADLELWLQDEENKSKLVLGDNLYIREVGIPDYWWDGTEKQQLETQKVDLTEYVKNTDYATSTKAGLVRPAGGLYMGGSNKDALLISRASNAQIDAKTDNNYPIVPSNLDYAVGSVIASETQRGTAKMWVSTDENGEVGLNISTEV